LYPKGVPNYITCLIPESEHTVESALGYLQAIENIVQG